MTTNPPLSVEEALTLPCPFCHVAAGQACRSITGKWSGPPDEMHYSRRTQPRPPKLGEFHANDGLFFTRQDDGGIEVAFRGNGLGAEVRVRVTEGAWLSVMCQMSARGECPETLGEAREFHRLDYGMRR